MLPTDEDIQAIPFLLSDLACLVDTINFSFSGNILAFDQFFHTTACTIKSHTFYRQNIT
jgi:hypothetical protein